MQKAELFNKLEAIVEEAKTALLVTTDSSGRGRMRWMTPILLRSRPEVIYAFSVPDTLKIEHIRTNDKIEWMFQTKDLREIVNVSGVIRLIDNPALKAELFDILGSSLTAFFKANAEPEEFIVLETIMCKATYFQPMKGYRDIVDFS